MATEPEMARAATTVTRPPGLRRDAIGLREVLFQSITDIVYLIYLYARHPSRVTEVGLVHLDDVEITGE